MMNLIGLIGDRRGVGRARAAACARLRSSRWACVVLGVGLAATGCGDNVSIGEPAFVCQIPGGTEPDYARQIGCEADFQILSSEPANASIPGARSTKTVIDRLDTNALYFQNSKKYAIHHAFASAHLSVTAGKPLVPDLTQFNQIEYSSPDRRFILGALTYYEGPGVWTYEIAPYDSATADMIEAAYRLISENSFIGGDLYVHPTSDAVAVEVAKLPPDVKVLTTDELFEGIDYQPLNLGQTMGRLVFVRAAELGQAGVYVTFRDIVVLDAVPNDVSVTSGILTQTFQTPLSHINVLSQNRGTPNMGLRGAFSDPALRALEGAYVELTVGPFDYRIREVTMAEADDWFESHRPDTVQVPELDLSVTDLRDIEDVLDIDNLSPGEALARAIPAFGGKASHYGAFPHMGQEVPHPKAFAIPVFYYRQFLEENGFDMVITEMLADEVFRADPAVRDQRLATLRDAMRAAPVNATFEAMLLAKLATDYPGIRMRFRSSTNAEDLGGFTGAGLYTSKSGDPNDPLYPVLDAVREVWASVWSFRAFEEREFRGIAHDAVGMALLVHRSFTDEEANGVALTANIFDTQCVEPGFYVNVQKGEASVVKPDPGVTTDQLIYHFDFPGQPIVYLTHSSLVPSGQTVLTRSQVFELGTALSRIHQFFFPLYGPQPGQAPCEHFYAMDVEFKFDGAPGQTPALSIKQARPHPGWGS